MFRFLSLGAGVQSSYLLLRAARGEAPPFDAVVMADTQNEPPQVYDWHKWLTEEVARSPIPMPMHVVTAGDLMAESLRLRVSRRTGNVYIRSLIPAYVAKPNGKKALMGRRCTAEFKVRILRAAQRRLAKVPRNCKTPMVEVTIGISLDEYIRVKPSTDPWSVNVHPLVDAGVTRQMCDDWIFETYGRRAPKSACEACPFHSDTHWAIMKREDPQQWQRCVAYDRNLRETARLQTGTARLVGDVFIHSSLRPLDEVEFADVPEREQVKLFGNECTGLCGV